MQKYFEDTTVSTDLLAPLKPGGQVDLLPESAVPAELPFRLFARRSGSHIELPFHAEWSLLLKQAGRRQFRVRLFDDQNSERFLLALLRAIDEPAGSGGDDLFLRSDTAAALLEASPRPLRELAEVCGLSKSRLEAYLTLARTPPDWRLELYRIHLSPSLELAEEIQRARNRKSFTLASALLQSDGSRKEIRRLKKTIGPARSSSARRPSYPAGGQTAQQAAGLPPGEGSRHLQSEPERAAQAGSERGENPAASQPPEPLPGGPAGGHKTTVYFPGTVLKERPDGQLSLELPAGVSYERYRLFVSEGLDRLLLDAEQFYRDHS